MTSPRVTITEFVQGARAPRSRNLTRVACAGVSTKGIYNSFMLINGSNPEDIGNQIGEDTKTGSVGLQCAIAEGARDTAFVRVMGGIRIASSTVTITGTGTASGTVTIHISQVSPAFTATYTANTTLAETANAVAQALATVINADATCPVTALVNGSAGALVLIAKLGGANGNTITYLMAETVVTDWTFSPSISTTLLGGANGPVKASASKVVGSYTALKDLQLVAIGEGIYSESYSFQVIPDTLDNTKIELILTDGSGALKTETYVFNFNQANLINGNEFATLRSSLMVRGFFTGADITAPSVPTIVTGSLSGGGEGSTIITDDYLAALKVIQSNQANIIYCPGQVDNSIRAALMSQAENATIREGLRIAVLSATRGVTPINMATETQAFNTNTGSGVMVQGYCTFSGQPSLTELSVSPDGFYAGHLAATPMYISPAARTSSPFFTSVVDVDTPKNDDTELDLIGDARCEAIILDPDTGGFHCLNGHTLASDSAQMYVSVRREANKIKTLLYFASQALKSENKGNSLLGSQSGTAKVTLDGLVKANEIQGFSILTSYVTTAGVQTDFQWHPFYPAEEIDYGMYRDSVTI